MHYVMCVCIPAVCLCTVNLIVSISFHVTLHVFHLLQVKSTFAHHEVNLLIPQIHLVLLFHCTS